MGMKRIDGEGKIICKFNGEMDTVACKEIDEDFTTVLNECTENDAVIPLELDVDGVDYVASSFLRLCGKAAKRLGTENLKIVNITPHVKKVFKIAGLADHMNIE